MVVRITAVRIPLGGPDRGHVADQPEHDPGDPQSQSEAESGRYGAVDDRDGARRAGGNYSPLCGVVTRV
jgi:hypothetical protein